MLFSLIISYRCFWWVPFYDSDRLQLGFFILPAWACCELKQSSGCLGCDTKSKLINDPLKGQSNLSEKFMTTSTCDMDNTGVLSRGHISSTSMLTQLHDTYAAGGSIKPTEFVNHGLLLWNQSRQKWIGNKEPRSLKTNLSEPNLSWNATYDSLLSNNKPFHKPIPLGEMVDFLVDIWEQEGMYD